MWYSILKKAGRREDFLPKSWISPDNKIIEIPCSHEDWIEDHPELGLSRNILKRDVLIGQNWCRISPGSYSLSITFPKSQIDRIIPVIYQYIKSNIDKIQTPISIELTDQSGKRTKNVVEFSKEDFLDYDIEGIKMELMI